MTGRLETVGVLLKWQPPLELKNVWGGTVLENTLWASIHHDRTVDYGPVVKALIDAGAKVRDEHLDWIRSQRLLLPTSKPSIEELLHAALAR